MRSRISGGLLVLAASLVLPTLPAFAMDGPGFELTPFVGARIGGSIEDKATGDDYDLDSSESFGMQLGIPWDPGSQLEIYYSRQSTDLDLAGFSTSDDKFSLDLDTLQIGGSVFFDQRGSALPFISGTLGGTRIKPDVAGTSADTFISFALGGGYRFYPSEHIGVRLEARINGIVVDSDSDIFCAGGPGGSGCLIRTSGDVLWQFEAQAGLIWRF